METYETTSRESPGQQSDGAGGADCISGNFYERIQGVLKTFLENEICDGVTYVQLAKRKTAAAMDEGLNGVNY